MMVDTYLHANRYSGFAFPLVCHCPIYVDDPIPNTQDYLKALVFLYKNYPYYDDVFFPLTTITSNCFNGTCFSTGHPRLHQLLFSRQLGLRFFGHTPALAVPLKYESQEGNQRFFGETLLSRSHWNVSAKCQTCCVQSQRCVCPEGFI
ncbi:MAG: hypothetical protein LBJ67_17275 [Planctomycetaceae bacterium]|jgi:hypothetical protein|nr:hypothetical protein [Planctomycetaceae bacterium]